MDKREFVDVAAVAFCTNYAKSRNSKMEQKIRSVRITSLLVSSHPNWPMGQ